jgi:hypothetical protein
MHFYNCVYQTFLHKACYNMSKSCIMIAGYHTQLETEASTALVINADILGDIRVVFL